MPDNARLNHGQSPLWGVVLCCTSILPEQRSEMAAVAQQMGAAHKLDLTSDVTHLIVGNIDTPKYKYVAKDRPDIKVLQPAWLDAVRESWIQGEDTDVAALEQQFALPTFFHLQICVTGFDDAVQRSEIQDTVTANGATYHGDLTKVVTHLIAAAPVGKKFEYAGAWGIKIVTLEWLNDSLQRGMALNETLYHPLLPLESRGKGAVSARQPPSPRLGKHPRAEAQPAEPAGGTRRKLRRTMSTRLESQNENLWADIGSGDARTNDPDEKGTNDAAAQQENRRTSSNVDDTLLNKLPENQSSAESHRIFIKDSIPVKIFIHGFDRRKAQLLRGYLSDNGAVVLSEDDMRQRLVQENNTTDQPTDDLKIVVPHDSHISVFEDLFDQQIASRRDTFVTEWWVEKCLHRKRLVDHATEPLCLPFKKFPIPGFESLIICPTSFSGIDLLLFSKAAKLMGAAYDESLTKRTSVLVCYEASANPGKLRYALENGIPIVSAEWMYDSIRHGRVEPFADYALTTSRQSQKSSQGCFFHPISNPRRADEKPPSFKTKKDRHTMRAPLRRGCLDLTKSPRPDDAGKDTDTNNPDPPPRPLQNLSPSRQNTQQQQQQEQDYAPTLPLEPSPTNSIFPSVAADASASASAKPADANSLASIDSLHISRGPADAASASASASADSAAPSEPKPPPVDAATHAANLNTAIAALLAQQQQKSTSRPSSASASSAAQAQPPQPPQPPRTLGRAVSNGSGTGLSRTNSLDARRAPRTAAEEDGSADDDEVLNARAHGGDSTRGGGFRPSQALSYEDPEGAAVREKLMARLGAGVDGGAEAAGMRVESIGVVKDAGGVVGDEKRRRATRRK